MRAVRVVVLITLVASARLAAQQPVFDVVSIKPHRDGPPVSLMGIRGTEFSATNMPVRQLVAYAYDLPASRVVEGPGWIDQDRYDISARPAAAGTPPQTPLKVRALLADRFRLATHSVMREATVYSLARVRADRLGPAMSLSTLDCTNGGPPFVAPQLGQALVDLPRRCTIATSAANNEVRMRAGAVTMADLARNMSQRLQTVVNDTTGLAGRFDFDLAFLSTSAAPGTVTDLPTLFTAMQEQLGLKLEAARGQLEYIVIDRVERPTEN